MFHTRKKYLLSGLIILLLVTSCSQANPLRQYSHKKVAMDLLISAISAEQQLNLTKSVSQAGSYYAACMQGKKSLNICQSLYKAMWQKLKYKYRGLTVTNLQDKKLWTYIKDYYQKDILSNHCPEIKSIHLNKAGFYIAYSCWKSKTNGHQYISADNQHLELSGWRYMKIVSFIQADAETDINTDQLELQSCEYRMKIKDNPNGPLLTMYLVPTKKHFVLSSMLGWEPIGVFSYVCKGNQKPKNCVFL